MPEETTPAEDETKAPSVEELIALKRSSVDNLREQIAAAKKAKVQGVIVTDGVIALGRLDAEEERLRQELAAVQAGVIAEPVRPSEEVSESSAPDVGTSEVAAVKDEDTDSFDSVAPSTTPAASPLTAPGSVPPPPPSAGSSSTTGRNSGPTSNS